MALRAGILQRYHRTSTLCSATEHKKSCGSLLPMESCFIAPCRFLSLHSGSVVSCSCVGSSEHLFRRQARRKNCHLPAATHIMPSLIARFIIVSWALLSGVFFFAGDTLLRFPPPTAFSARTTPAAESTQVVCLFALSWLEILAPRA